MFSSLLVACAALFLPPAALVMSGRHFRARAFVNFPFALLIHFAAIGSFAACLQKSLPYGREKFFLVMALSFAVTFLLLKLLNPTKTVKSLPTTLLFLVGALAILSVLDVILITAHQGWGDSLFNAGKIYFRGPFNNDCERNVILVNALLRGTQSPFLPGAAIHYQIFWHHWAALIVGLFGVPAQYPLVMGCQVATALVLFFVLIWIVAQRRPTLFHGHWPLLAVFLLLIGSHADLWSAAFSLARGKGLTIEPPWEFPNWNYFRYFSPKFVALAAPQHATFFLFALPLLAFRQLSRGAKMLLIIFSVMSSPMLACFFFVPYAFSRRLKASDLPWTLGALILAVPFYEFAFSHSLFDLFLRKGGSALKIFARDWRSWVSFPLGILIVFGPLAVVLALRSRKKFFLTIVPIVFLFNLLVTNIELRRHSSILVSFLAVLCLVRAFPRPREWSRSLAVRASFGITATLCLALHVTFIHFFITGPSVLAREVPWEDYRALNQEIARRFPSLPVLAAPSDDLGLIFPVPLEVTTSWGHPQHAEAHNKIAKTVLWRKVLRDGPTLLAGRAIELGYEGIVWGPVEEREWGEQTRRRFIDERNLLARSGSVSLYRLDDKFAQSPNRAQLLTSEGWYGEAYELQKQR